MGLTRRVYVVTEVDVTRSQKNCVQLYNLMEGGDKLLHNTVSKPADIPQNVLLLQLNGPNCCEHSEEGLWAGDRCSGSDRREGVDTETEEEAGTTLWF